MLSFHSRVQNARICAIVNISFILYKVNNRLVDRPEDFFLLSLEVNSSGEFGDLYFDLIHFVRPQLLIFMFLQQSDSKANKFFVKSLQNSPPSFCFDAKAAFSAVLKFKPFESIF